MTRRIVIRQMNCPKSPDSRPDQGYCSDLIVDKLKARFNCKLKAITEADTLEGSVSISHGSTHVFDIEFYDKNESPTLFRKSTLKKLPTIPTKAEVTAELLAN